jgi:hypothetical protein
MIVPFAKPAPHSTVATGRIRPSVKPQYLDMAASQMQAEGKFQPPSADATSSAAMQSTQPSNQLA